MKRKKALPERGKNGIAPTEAYFTETLGLRQLHVRLPVLDYKHLQELAAHHGHEKRLRPYLSELIQKEWSALSGRKKDR